MYNRNDPRFRRTLNQISQNLESANEQAQEGLFSFSEHYVKPCFGAIGAALEPCTATCIPSQRDRLRRHQHQARARGRLERSFDFYDDWEDEENDALLALEEEDFDRVAGGYGTLGDTQQPRGSRGIMSYGAGASVRPSRTRRKSTTMPYDVGADPTAIPRQSYFGFLSRLPFNLGRGVLRYKPSAADLQVRAKADAELESEGEVIVEDDEDEAVGPSEEPRTRMGRTRSATVSSGHTTDSYSSRGDIFPSDEEDDAIPLDDEFAVALDRRTTNSGRDDSSTGDTKSRSRTETVQTQSEPPSSKNSSSGRKKRKKKNNRTSSNSTPRSQSSDPEMGELPSLAALKQEERKAETEEEADVEKKRIEAQRLAVERGLEMPGPGQADDSPRIEKLDSPVQARPDSPPAEHDLRQESEPVTVVEGPISMQDNEGSGRSE